MINNGPPARRLERQHQRFGRAGGRVVEPAHLGQQPARGRQSRVRHRWPALDHGDQPSAGDRHPVAEVLAAADRRSTGCRRPRLDRLDPEVAAHGFRIGLLHQRDQPLDPRHGVVAGVVGHGQVSARLEHPGDLGQAPARVRSGAGSERPSPRRSGRTDRAATRPARRRAAGCRAVRAGRRPVPPARSRQNTSWPPSCSIARTRRCPSRHRAPGPRCSPTIQAGTTSG